MSQYNDWAVPRNLLSLVLLLLCDIPPLWNTQRHCFVIYTRAEMHSCEECAVLSQAVSPEGTDIPLSTLEKAGQGENSCPILAILYQGVMLYKGKWGILSEENSIYVLVAIRITKDSILEADIRKVWEVMPVRIAMVEFYVLPGCSLPWPVPERSSTGGGPAEGSEEPSGLASSIRGISNRLSLEPESQELYGMISTWIQSCHDDHSVCKSSTSSRTLPTRVIDVGPPDGKTAPRLCDTNGEPGDYIALSHCWGGRQPLITTKENISSMKACIPWDKLPNTFQDAITVTRRLGIAYIWIDSLCIVQDDAQDWEREAAKMALIFESAYLTIAATAATNSTQGLFPRERGHEFAMGNSEAVPHVFMREKRSDDSFLPRRLNTGDLSMEVEVDYSVDGLYPLQRRAWCFQELILSPRVLHFTHSEIVWHCRTKWDCECGAVGLGGSYIRKFNAFLQNPAVYEEEDEFAQSVRWPEISAGEPSRSWYNIVSVFTANQITYREDILPALSGTAKKFELLRSGQYIAGLWESSFAHDLSWHVHSTDRSSRPQNYLGPSFSWCSCVSRIEWANWTHGYTPRLEILELSSAIDGIDPTGKVSNAFAKVRGLMTTAHLILQTRPRMTSMEDALRQQAAEDGNVDATLETSENATDLAPGDPRAMTQCAIIRAQETQPGAGDILRATRCRLDTVDDICYASFCREKKSNGSLCDCCEDGSWRRFDGTHPKDLCTDQNLVYCLRILEFDREGDKIIVALILVPLPDIGPKRFKRIGIVYDMAQGFFGDEQEQELTLV